MTFMDRRLLILFITATLQLMGVGLAIPSIPSLIREFSTDTKTVSLYFSLFFSLYGLCQFLAAPLLGALSDKFGRKPILLLSLFIASCDYLFMTYSPNITLLLIFRMISGFCAANVTICMASASDISDIYNRGTNYSTISAGFGLGLIVGPALGGLIGQYHHSYPFYAASLLYFINFLFVLFVLPETLKTKNKAAINVKRLNPWSGVKRTLLNKKTGMLCLFYFIIHYCAATNPAIWSLYTEYRYQWGPREIGLSLTVVGVLTFLSQALLSRLLMPKLGYLKVLKFSVMGNIIAYLGFAFAESSVQVYLAILFLSFFFLAAPATQALISQTRPSDEQGELQGSLVSLNSLSSFLNPLISTQIFSYFALNFRLPGAPYIVASFLSMIVFLGILRFEKRN